MKIIIIDFYDSFTFNIACEFKCIGLESETIPYKKFNFEMFNENEKYLFVLGPGPGHPKEYEDFFPIVRQIRDSSNSFLLGICLGHQIILSEMGHKISSAKKIIHGESVLLNLNSLFWSSIFDTSSLEVQRYNSLSFNKESITEKSDENFLYDEDLDLMAFSYRLGEDRVLTYQFHPESIGTNCRNLIFKSTHKYFI
jgi:anthranilate/para-aminobenzoate synthase component II